ncbi:MAG: HAMP domain-containing histidine kinase [Oscillospiraceae bacterium]|nr:HAMP domain-containing histidine kinase [Oscillospiraceae bacterium]
MLYWLLAAAGILILLLSWKIYRMKAAAREIGQEFAEKLQSDTNTLIGISSTDRDMCRLADSINKQLVILREEHQLYHQGNAELKRAVSNISHDLRTPLTAICGYLDLMKKTDDPETVRHYRDIMSERATRMKHLTEELFRYSVILSDERETQTEDVYINQLLAESITGFYPALTGRGITPEITIPDTRIIRRVNREDLARVFSNLLNNAVKYSDGDLQITLSESGEITFTNSAASLTPVQVGQLFDRFYTVETAHYSTGLGLSIARTLTERMGGMLLASYDSGKLTFCLSLPA